MSLMLCICTSDVLMFLTTRCWAFTSWPVMDVTSHAVSWRTKKPNRIPMKDLWCLYVKKQHVILLTLDAIKLIDAVRCGTCLHATSLPKHCLCLYSTHVFLVSQGKVCCGQEVCREMLGPRVRCKVHEEETERPRLPDGDHPWNRSPRVGYSQPAGGQPPPGLRDGLWDGAGPGIVSIEPVQQAKTLTQAWNMNTCQHFNFVW